MNASIRDAFESAKLMAGDAVDRRRRRQSFQIPSSAPKGLIGNVPKQRRSSSRILPSPIATPASTPRGRRKSFLMIPTANSAPPKRPVRRASSFSVGSIGSSSGSDESPTGRRRRAATIVTNNVKFQRIIEDMAVTEEDMKEFLDQGGLQALKQSMKSSGVVTHSSVLQGIHFFVRDCNIRDEERI